MILGVWLISNGILQGRKKRVRAFSQLKTEKTEMGYTYEIIQITCSF